MGRQPRRTPKRLAEKLLTIRTSLGLSQSQVSRHLKLNLDRSDIANYELGNREPQLDVLLGYARLAGVCVERLIDDGLDLPKLPAKGHKP